MICALRIAASGASRQRWTWLVVLGAVYAALLVAISLGFLWSQISNPGQVLPLPHPIQPHRTGAPYQRTAHVRH